TGHIETYIVGVEKPFVGINLDAMEWLGADELLYVFGQEIDRIKSQQMVYHQMAVVMPTLKNLLNSTTLGVGGLVASGMERALYNWRMMARFTADRAAMLACQDIDVATTTLMKLAGLPDEYLTTAVIEDFLAQAREFASNNFDSADQLIKILSHTEPGLSWVVMRAGELLKWVDSGEYENIIQQKNLETPEEAQEKEGTTEEEKEGWNFLTSW
ncbi:MAG: M48 family metallopeptidase, partial [Nostoc sp. C3-bin3]|nr:M48 family metallopeptidase [Nostoc sp. C3-bin3]